MQYRAGKMGQAEAGKMGPHFSLYTPYDFFFGKN